MIRDHLKRLSRSWDHSYRTYDSASLLDLAMHLRIWADMREQLPAIAPRLAAAKDFRTASMSQRGRRLLAGTDYFVAYMPEGTLSAAGGGHVITYRGPESLKLPYFIGGVAKFLDSQGPRMLMRCFIFAAGDLRTLQQKEVATGEQIRRVSFSSWLDGEAVAVVWGGVRRSISREAMIRRVANTLGGAHPMGMVDRTHDADEVIRFMMQFYACGLSLPYFVLMKMAQDILEIAPRYMD